MRAKAVCIAGLVAASLGLGIARGQNPSPSVGGVMSGLETNPSNPGAILNDAPRVPGNVPFYTGPQSLEPPGANNIPPPPQTQQTSWILYPRWPGCCCPKGLNGPICEELFLNVGPSFNVSGGVFGHELGTGWDIEGGARTLLFNPECTADWRVSFSVSNINNHASDQTQHVTLLNVPIQTSLGIANLPSASVTLKSLNRTYANLGFGHDWYLWGPAHVEGISHGELPNVRVGVEGGGRYGTEMLRVNELRHLTDTIGGLYVALYADYEHPWHCCVFTAGLRVEYGYTWDDILQHQNPSDVQDINLLVTAGVRF